MRPMPKYPPVKEQEPAFAAVLARTLGDCIDIAERAFPGFASGEDGKAFLARLPVQPIRRDEAMRRPS
jgi:hypothetical protein